MTTDREIAQHVQNIFDNPHLFPETMEVLNDMTNHVNMHSTTNHTSDDFAWSKL